MWAALKVKHFKAKSSGLADWDDWFDWVDWVDWVVWVVWVVWDD